jgi:hypothetical protein
MELSMRPVDPILHSPPSSSRNGRETGSILIILILAILLFAALGAAVYTLSTSSSYSKLTANLSARAYYSAESGYRYAASEYRNAGDIFARMARLESLHGITRTLPNSLGTFTIAIHPYFFITNSQITTGDNLFSARTPGEFPSGFTVPATIRLSLGNNIYDATLIAQTQPNSVDFQVAGGGIAETLQPNTIVCLVTKTIGNQVVTPGSGIVLDVATSGCFPNKNGYIGIGAITAIYTYMAKDMSPPPGQTRLTGIQKSGSSTFPALPILGGSDVILKPYAEITITGQTADASLGGERKITYFVPISDNGGFEISTLQ